MLRVVALVLGGVFVGAVAMEVVHKRYPDRLDKLYSKVGNFASGIKNGFKEVYKSVAKTQEPAQA